MTPTSKECEQKHKTINVVHTLVFTIITCTWAIFTPMYIYLYNSNQAIASDVDKYKTKIEVLENTNFEQHKNIIATLAEVKTDLKDIKAQLNNVERELASIK